MYATCVARYAASRAHYARALCPGHWQARRIDDGHNEHSRASSAELFVEAPHGEMRRQGAAPVCMSSYVHLHIHTCVYTGVNVFVPLSTSQSVWHALAFACLPRAHMRFLLMAHRLHTHVLAQKCSTEVASVTRLLPSRLRLHICSRGHHAFPYHISLHPFTSPCLFQPHPWKPFSRAPSEKSGRACS